MALIEIKRLTYIRSVQNVKLGHDLSFLGVKIDSRRNDTEIDMLAVVGFSVQ
jgi:hypothetical protein